MTQNNWPQKTWPSLSTNCCLGFMLLGGGGVVWTTPNNPLQTWQCGSLVGLDNAELLQSSSVGGHQSVNHPISDAWDDMCGTRDTTYASHMLLTPGLCPPALHFYVTKIWLQLVRRNKDLLKPCFLCILKWMFESWLHSLSLLLKIFLSGDKFKSISSVFFFSR